MLWIRNIYLSFTLFLFLYLLENNKLIKSNKFLPLNVKVINPIQTYLHIIESFACIQEIFVLIFLFNINFSISIQSKYAAYYSHINLSHQFQLISTHQDLLQIPHTLS